ncbi:hypothetical protein RM531_08015 [Salinisphaera sp. P385]|uniref:Uncharacterized protein n=1 Tax=Spectribacter acetivorans TaxID=3075603 RepID=A0ABU3B864_9GAMM|nr:hypothetical protein [Salinisphaera sp. P385]MDT0618419.1 hypothetical protein [Salinisphaera sp. P385]
MRLRLSGSAVAAPLIFCALRGPFSNQPVFDRVLTDVDRRRLRFIEVDSACFDPAFTRKNGQLIQLFNASTGSVIPMMPDAFIAADTIPELIGPARPSRDLPHSRKRAAIDWGQSGSPGWFAI